MKISKGQISGLCAAVLVVMLCVLPGIYPRLRWNVPRQPPVDSIVKNNLKIRVNPDGLAYDDMPPVDSSVRGEWLRYKNDMPSVDSAKWREGLYIDANGNPVDTNRYFYVVYEVVKDSEIVQICTRTFRCSGFFSFKEIGRREIKGDKSKGVVILYIYEFKNMYDCLNSIK